LLFIVFELSLSQMAGSYVSSKKLDRFESHLMTIPGEPERIEHWSVPVSTMDRY